MIPATVLLLRAQAVFQCRVPFECVECDSAQACASSVTVLETESLSQCFSPSLRPLTSTLAFGLSIARALLDSRGAAPYGAGWHMTDVTAVRAVWEPEHLLAAFGTARAARTVEEDS